MRPAPSITVRLAEVRRAQGLSQAELGRRSGVNQSVISRLEAGQCGVDLRVLARLAEALGVNAATLVFHLPPKR